MLVNVLRCMNMLGKQLLKDLQDGGLSLWNAKAREESGTDVQAIATLQIAMQHNAHVNLETMIQAQSSAQSTAQFNGIWWI